MQLGLRKLFMSFGAELPEPSNSPSPITDNLTGISVFVTRLPELSTSKVNMSVDSGTAIPATVLA